MRYATTWLDYLPDEDPPDPVPPEKAQDAKLISSSAVVVEVRTPRLDSYYDQLTTVVRLHWFWDLGA